MDSKKTVAFLGLAIAIAGVANFIAEVRYSFGYQWYVPLYMKVRPFAVRLPFIYYPVDILFCIALLAVSVLFLLKNRGFRVLAFLSGLILAQQGARVLILVFQFLLKLRSDPFPVATFLIHLLLAASAFYTLLVFKKTWQPEVHAVKQEASKWLRLAGYGIDIFIFVFLVLPYPYDEQRLVIIALLFAFYFVFEGVYLLTPGKILLNTRVETAAGQPPEDSAILIRTLSRFIPLEPLSFLFGQGWHDRLSNTRVFKYK